MIQRLHELSRLYSDFPLHQLLIVVFLFFALLIPFADRLGQIIFELVARLVFPSLLATGLLPLLHALAQLSHELHLFLHPLQLLQELLHRQLGTDIEQLPAYREGAFHKLLVTQRFDVGDDVEDGLVELGGVLDEDVVNDPEVELHGLALDLFLVDCGLAPADLSDDAHGLAAVLEPPQVVLQLAERQHIQNIKDQACITAHLRCDSRLTGSSLLRMFITRMMRFHLPLISSIWSCQRPCQLPLHACVEQLLDSNTTISLRPLRTARSDGSQCFKNQTKGSPFLHRKQPSAVNLEKLSLPTKDILLRNSSSSINTNESFSTFIMHLSFWQWKKKLLIIYDFCSAVMKSSLYRWNIQRLQRPASTMLYFFLSFLLTSSMQAQLRCLQQQMKVIRKHSPKNVPTAAPIIRFQSQFRKQSGLSQVICSSSHARQQSLAWLILTIAKIVSSLIPLFMLTMFIKYTDHLKGWQMSRRYLTFLGMTQEQQLSNSTQYNPSNCNLSYNFLLVLLSSFQYPFSPSSLLASYWLSWWTVSQTNLLMFLPLVSTLMAQQCRILMLMSFSSSSTSSLRMLSCDQLEKQTFLLVPALTQSSWQLRLRSFMLLPMSTMLSSTILFPIISYRKQIMPSSYSITSSKPIISRYSQNSTYSMMSAKRTGLLVLSIRCFSMFTISAELFWSSDCRWMSATLLISVCRWEGTLRCLSRKYSDFFTNSLQLRNSKSPYVQFLQVLSLGCTRQQMGLTIASTTYSTLVMQAMLAQFAPCSLVFYCAALPVMCSSCCQNSSSMKSLRSSQISSIITILSSPVRVSLAMKLLMSSNWLAIPCRFPLLSSKQMIQLEMMAQKEVFSRTQKLKDSLLHSRQPNISNSGSIFICSACSQFSISLKRARKMGLFTIQGLWMTISLSSRSKWYSTSMFFCCIMLNWFSRYSYSSMGVRTMFEWAFDVI